MRETGAERLVVLSGGRAGSTTGNRSPRGSCRTRGSRRTSVRFLGPVRSTADEAALAAGYVERCGWTEVAVATSPYHTRRAGWLFERAMGDDVTVAWSRARSRSTPGSWWRTDAGREVVLLEWIKGLSRRRRTCWPHRTRSTPTCPASPPGPRTSRRSPTSPAAGAYTRLSTTGRPNSTLSIARPGPPSVEVLSTRAPDRHVHVHAGGEGAQLARAEAAQDARRAVDRRVVRQGRRDGHDRSSRSVAPPRTARARTTRSSRCGSTLRPLITTRGSSSAGSSTSPSTSSSTSASWVWGSTA